MRKQIVGLWLLAATCLGVVCGAWIQGQADRAKLAQYGNNYQAAVTARNEAQVKSDLAQQQLEAANDKIIALQNSLNVVGKEAIDQTYKATEAQSQSESNLRRMAQLSQEEYQCTVQLNQASAQIQQRQATGQISPQTAAIMIDVLKAILH